MTRQTTMMGVKYWGSERIACTVAAHLCRCVTAEQMRRRQSISSRTTSFRRQGRHLGFEDKSTFSLMVLVVLVAACCSWSKRVAEPSLCARSRMITDAAPSSRACAPAVLQQFINFIQRDVVCRRMSLSATDGSLIASIKYLCLVAAFLGWRRECERVRCCRSACVRDRTNFSDRWIHEFIRRRVHADGAHSDAFAAAGRS